RAEHGYWREGSRGNVPTTLAWCRPGWEKKLHVGLVGTGRIGMLHARTLKGSPLVSTLTLVDADQGRAAAVAAQVGAAQAESPQALLSAGVDALVIAAATPVHAELLHMAADASVPTFCETPIEPDLGAEREVLRQRGGVRR